MGESTGSMINLTATNFLIWKPRMQDLLYCKDLMDPILAKGVKPTAVKDDEWTKMNMKTIGHIRQWIDNSVFHHVAQETDAYQLWIKLEGMYERKTARNKALLMRSLVNLKYRDGQQVAEHLSEFQSLINQLSTVKIDWGDEIQALLLLSSLPASWEMGSRSSEKQHIVMLPYMAHGHLIPFLALANQIHRRTGFTITIANTPLNIAYLRRSSSATGPIRFVALPFNSSDHGLPPNTENTEALPLPLIVTLFHSSTALEAPTLELIADITAADGRPPICIISDVFLGWATRVAEQSGTVNVSFTTGGGYGTAAYVSVWQNLPHREIVAAGGDEEFQIPGFPDRCRVRPSELHPFVRIADGNDPWSQFFRPQISLSLKSFGWLCNTAEEIEPMGLQILRNFTNRPVWSIGPLLPRSGGRHSGRESGISPEKCLEWLDSYPEASVLFISFGSQNTISPTQMMELAKGLEESNKPFIWVIRPPTGFDPKAEFDAGKWLPPGFENRAQGLLVRGWAPQVEILCHKSTGAFLSHSGWNSTVESLSQGVPIIGWPLAAEQVYNCKMMEEEMGVCVELCNGVQGKVERGDVKRAVEMVLGEGEKGREMKKKAVEIGEMIRAALREDGGEEGFQKGSSLQAMDDFVSAILSAKKEREGEMKI